MSSAETELNTGCEVILGMGKALGVVGWVDSEAYVEDRSSKIDVERLDLLAEEECGGPSSLVMGVDVFTVRVVEGIASIQHWVIVGAVNNVVDTVGTGPIVV